jgi:hypothetical protein
MNQTEQIKLNDRIIAIIIYSEYNKDGIEFFTPGEFSQQLGYMKHKKGDTIQEHVHILHTRDKIYAGDVICKTRTCKNKFL